MDLKEKIIEKIRRNHISTTEILDIHGKDPGFYKGIYPLTPGSYAVGEVYQVQIVGESNYQIHKKLKVVPKGAIVFVETHGISRAAFGSLVCKYLFLYRGVQAVVCNGPLRDGHTLIKEGYAVWCRGLTAVGCFNEKRPRGNSFSLGGSPNCHTAIFICDDSGIAIIPRPFHKETLDKLDKIEALEDAWFASIDAGLDTFDVVCKGSRAKLLKE